MELSLAQFCFLDTVLCVCLVKSSSISVTEDDEELWTSAVFLCPSEREETDSLLDHLLDLIWHSGYLV